MKCFHKVLTEVTVRPCKEPGNRSQSMRRRGASITDCELTAARAGGP